MTTRAYVDESEPDQRPESGSYILAATIIPAKDEERLRNDLLRLRFPGTDKIHWYKENAKRRHLLSEAVASFSLTHIIAMRTATAESSQRRRRMCLRALLCGLREHGVIEAVLEARERKQNEGDLHVLEVLRAQQLLDGGLRVGHQVGKAEPLLWIPDVIAGVIGARLRGDPTYLQSFKEGIQIITT